MDLDKANSRENDATELSDRGKYNHLPEDSATSKMVGRKADDLEDKHSPEGGKLLPGTEGGVTTEVKFISPSDDTHNGDANINIEAVKIAFAGMGKEELMKFANDPFWIRLRWFLFIVFWLLWAAMLAIAIVIIVMAPKCAAPAPKTWWEQSPLYEIHVPSFKDGSEVQDGKGDLKGIKEELGYLDGLGIKGVVLSSILKSSNGASDGSVENFIEIDPEFGTMEDLESLTSAMKDKDMNLIMRFIPNHSSSKHPWFIKSVQREDPYTDYYVWAPKKGVGSTGESIPPNNWRSVYDGSAWEWNSERDAFYLHQFDKDQPDLNFANPLVIQEFKKIFAFWIEKGVNGFLLDKVEFLLEDESRQDETFNTRSKSVHDQYDFYDHRRTNNLPGVPGVLSVFKETIKNKTESGVLAVTANVTTESLISYYFGEDSEVVVDLPFNHKILTFLNKAISATGLNSAIEDWFTQAHNESWPNWEIGSASTSRLATRLSPDMVDGIHMVFMLLPGTPISYYGDELGMEDLSSKVAPAGSVGYHPARGLMQWRNTTNAGFSEAATTWISASDSYPVNNVEAQMNAEESHYKVYKMLVEARKSPSIMYGSRKMHVFNDTVLAYTRVKSGSPGHLVLFNVGDTDAVINLSPFTDIPEELTVLIRSVGFKDKEVQIKSKLHSDSISIPSHDALVLTYVPKDKE